MDDGVAHHPALADFAAPRLELRLDQRDQFCALFGEPKRRAQHLGKPYKTGVAYDNIYRVRHCRLRQRLGVGLFHHDDAVVLAQFPRELVGADIDRKDLSRAAAEQNVGEAPGRRANVEPGRADDVEAEMVEAVGQLDSPARNPRMVAALDAKGRLLGDELAGLGDALVPGEDIARENQCLCASAAFGEPLRYQQLVGAYFQCLIHTRSRSSRPISARAGLAAGSSVSCCSSIRATRA